MDSIDDIWYDFTSVYVKKLRNAKGDWSQLTEEEQELAALWKLEMDMFNGGFIQFISNWGLECYNNVRRCLTKINASQALSIIERQYAIIQKSPKSENLEDFKNIPTLLTEEENNLIEQIDEEYWERTDKIASNTLKVYKHLIPEIEEEK